MPLSRDLLPRAASRGILPQEASGLSICISPSSS